LEKAAAKQTKGGNGHWCANLLTWAAEETVWGTKNKKGWQVSLRSGGEKTVRKRSQEHNPKFRSAVGLGGGP